MAKRTAKKQRAPRSLPKRPSGRPAIFANEKLRKLFLDALGAGASRNDACKLIGCVRTTLDSSMDRDPELRAAVEEKEIGQKILAIGCITSHARTNPQVAMQYLARKHPNEWAYRKPDVVTRAQFKAMLDQLIAHILSIVPNELHAQIMQGVNDMLMAVVGGEPVETPGHAPV